MTTGTLLALFSKMDTDSAHKSNWAIAEIVFGVPCLIGIGLQFVFPFSLYHGIVNNILVAVGITLIMTSIVFIVLSRRELSDYGQPTDPGHPTSKIVKTGMFSISRNPLYLSAVILFFGIGLMMNTFWVLVALLASIIACHFILIIPEERYLAAKFGEEYKDYTNIVHRWFGRR
jgi:protein-S-isoprenylcysteine O-methyltransferase Ste14